MSIHSYSHCWLHMVWATLNRQRLLDKHARLELNGELVRYAKEKSIFLQASFVNTDHVHILIDLPTNQTIEQVAKLFKGSSSHWVNEQQLVQGRFAWQRGYGAFSVSQSQVERVCAYIANQEEHHKSVSFQKEYQRFVQAYALVWHDEETGEMIAEPFATYETVKTVSPEWEDGLPPE